MLNWVLNSYVRECLFQEKRGALVSRKLYTALTLLSLIWGGSFLFIKVLLGGFDPWAVAFLRSGFGLIVITLVMLIGRKPFGWSKIPWIPMIFIALINTAIPWALIGFSETRLDSSIASILNATTPLWTIVVGVVLFRSITSRLQWLGMGVALVGLVILVGLDSGSLVSVNPIGLVEILCATLCYGLGTHLAKRFLKGLTMYQLTFATLLTAMVGSGILAFSTGKVEFSHLASWPIFSSAIGVGVFGAGLAYILFYFMIQEGSPEFATMVTYLVPITAIVWGFLLLHEQVSWNMLIGLVLILGGVYVANLKKTPAIATVSSKS